jgi:hypothetical protein
MKKHLLLFALLVSLVSCKTGKRAFEKGDYEQAVFQAVERLRDDTDNKDASNILPAAYNLGLQTRLRQIEQLKSSMDPYKHEGLARNYRLLNRLANEIQRCPSCLQLVKPKRFDAEEERAANAASAYRLQLAKTKLQSSQERPVAIDAYRDLEVAQSFTPNDQAVIELKNEALYFATLRVVVQPLYGRNQMSFGYMDVMNQRLVNYLHNTNINPFVRFYTPEEAIAQNLEFVDHEIELGITYFSPERNTAKDTYTLTKDSVLIVDGRNQKPRYGTVSATVVEHTVTYNSTASLAIVIHESRQQVPIRTELLSNGFVWEDHWATFRGDERALTKKALELTRQKPQARPNPDFLFKATSEPLYDQAVDFLRRYYTGY